MSATAKRVPIRLPAPFHSRARIPNPVQPLKKGYLDDSSFPAAALGSPDHAPDRHDQTVTGVRGINHVTLTCDDVEASVTFYRDVLGCRLLARWPEGAYLVAGNTWVALVLKTDPDYSHVAFDVAPEAFDDMRDRLLQAGTPEWKQNRSEGESVYFLDPGGHELEIHASGLRARLASARKDPWPGLEILDDSLPIAGPIGVAGNGRQFSCYAVGVDVYLIDAQERFLLLRHPETRNYEVVNGGVEAGESLAEAALREVGEEAGPAVEARLLAPFDAGTHVYFGMPLISVGYVAEYVRGEVVPGDDMAGSDVLWATADEIEAQGLHLGIPEESEAFRRALDVARLWREAR